MVSPDEKRQLLFVVFGKPQPKQRARKSKSGHFYTPEETRRYEAAVKGAARLAVRELGEAWPLDRQYKLTMRCYFPDNRPRDLDNVIKSVADGMNKVAYQDDRRIRECSAVREIDRSHPRTEVLLELV
jgi:Holliday junction resolvase RusA-like endonuclease